MPKNFKHTEETKKRLSEIAKKQWVDGRVSRKGLFKNGFKHTEETKKKISEKMSKIQIGENNSNWKNGVTMDNSRDRRTKKNAKWKIGVFERDNYTCKKCGKRGGKINAHHIKNYSKYPKLRFDLDNGITFCIDCHKLFHKKNGKLNNNMQQIIEFL